MKLGKLLVIGHALLTDNCLITFNIFVFRQRIESRFFV